MSYIETLSKKNYMLVRRLERVMDAPPLSDLCDNERKALIQRVTTASSWDAVSNDDKQLVIAAEGDFARLLEK